MQHQPGKENLFSDATSRHPVKDDESSLNCVRIYDELTTQMDINLLTIASSNVEKLRAVTWDIIKKETLKDPQLVELMNVIRSGFPAQRFTLPPHLAEYWNQRDNLYIVDDVILMQHRAVVPEYLRQEILCSLHSAHQGETAMCDRARQTCIGQILTMILN